MSFSANWESTYKSKRHLSRWPWTNLVSRVYTHCSWQKKPFRVLELGCGVGANIPFFQGIEAEYYALEGSETAVRDIHDRFSQLKEKVQCADFSNPLPFENQFDLIFDRAALTHNKSADIARCLNNAYASLAHGGVYIGVDWYSNRNTYATRGTALTEDAGTRVNFMEGPYMGIEPMRFSTKEEVKGFFRNFRILELTEESSQLMEPTIGPLLASWHIVAKKE